MKCLVLAPQRYGIREVAQRVGQEWEAMGHDVEYELPNGAAARIGSVTVGIPGIAVWWRKQFKELAQRPDEYDLIWTHQPLSPTVPSRDSDLWDRVVVTFHTTEHAKYQLASEGVYPRTRQPYHLLTRSLEGWFYRRLSKLDRSGPQYTIVSAQLQSETAAFGITNPTCIPNGVFIPNDRDFAPIREEYGIPLDATLVFNIGSLSAQKRPVLFAETMAAVCAEREDLYCVMAGKGSLEDAVESHTSEKLRAIGYVSDEEKWRWFTDSDLFVSLSAYEGLPIASLEALSFGLPVVLSDIAAHRTLVSEYEATGKCVSADRHAIAAAIERVEDKTANVSLPEWDEIAAEYLELVQ